VRNSKVNTVSVPIAGSVAPATLYVADKSPLRLLVRNSGGTPVFLAHEADTLVNIGSSGVLGTFQLPAGDSEVFILAPKQGMYATAFGNGGELTIAISEAIPITMES
jgi:hypothetical protein